jgi:hypothetical protein
MIDFQAENLYLYNVIVFNSLSIRKGAGAVELARLESVCTFWVPWVRIPPFPQADIYYPMQHYPVIPTSYTT